MTPRVVLHAQKVIADVCGVFAIAAQIYYHARRSKGEIPHYSRGEFAPVSSRGTHANIISDRGCVSLSGRRDFRRRSIPTDGRCVTGRVEPDAEKQQLQRPGGRL
jgi:hypothetical protein